MARRSRSEKHLGIARKQRGPVQLPSELLDRVDAWIASLPKPPPRDKAIQFLIASGLENTPAPKEFNQRPLTAFMYDAMGTRYATFANRRSVVECMIKIDSKMTALHAVKNPEDPLSVMLAARSIGAYRAACEHALAGQVAEVFPLARACIENAAYAVYLAGDESLAEAWIRRHDSEETRNNMRRKSWHHKTIREYIGSKSDEIGILFGELYENFIDYGGHPNERSISLNARVEQGEEIRIEQTLLHGDGSELLFGLNAAMEAGSCALALLRLIFPSELGMDEEEDRQLRAVLADARRAASGGAQEV